MPGDMLEGQNADPLRSCISNQFKSESDPQPLIPPAPATAKKRHVFGRSSGRIEPLRISAIPELSQAFDLAKRERRSHGAFSSSQSDSSDWMTVSSNTIPETLNSSREWNVPLGIDSSHAASHDDVRNPAKATPLKSSQRNHLYSRTPISTDKENFFTPRKTSDPPSVCTPAQTRCPLSSLPVESIPYKESIDGVNALPSNQESDLHHSQAGNAHDKNPTESVNQKPCLSVHDSDGFRTPQCKSLPSQEFRPRFYGVSSSKYAPPIIPLHPAVVAGQKQARLMLHHKAESRAPVDSSASRRLIDTTPFRSAPPLSASSVSQNVTRVGEGTFENQPSVPLKSRVDSSSWPLQPKISDSCQGNVHAPSNTERLHGARAGQNIVHLMELPLGIQPHMNEPPESSVSSSWLPQFKDKTTLCRDDPHQAPHIDNYQNGGAIISPPRPSRFEMESSVIPHSKILSEPPPNLSRKSGPVIEAQYMPAAVSPPEPAKAAEPVAVPPIKGATPVHSTPLKVKEQVNEGLKVGTVGHGQIAVNGHSYTILSLLGRGGSSKVFQVLDPATSELKAVKCVNLAETEQSICEGYLNEIKLLADLQDGDCVIRMYDHEHRKNHHMLFVVMEKGDTDLSKLIKDVSKSKKISAAMIVYYWTEMLNAVSFIHKRGTIHSDLKPANFLLVSGRLKLIDFGIASAVQDDMTSIVKDCMTGTYNYISPEALSSTSSDDQQYKISYKSDVWSLGCILYSLIYGRTPFQHVAGQFQKLSAIVNPSHKIQFPAPPIEGCPSVLLQALKMCLIRNPKERASVDELLQLPYLDHAGPERGVLSQIASLAASVGLVQESEDNRYATVVRAIQRLIIENERQLPFLGGRR